MSNDDKITETSEKKECFNCNYDNDIEETECGCCCSPIKYTSEYYFERIKSEKGKKGKLTESFIIQKNKDGYQEIILKEVV